jgi:hypothetical protein
MRKKSKGKDEQCRGLKKGKEAMRTEICEGTQLTLWRQKGMSTVYFTIQILSCTIIL